MANAILKAFNAAHVAEGFDPDKHALVVMLDDKIVAEISPSLPGYHDRLWAGPSRTPIGPVFDPDKMRSIVCNSVFAGDAAAMGRARVERVARR